MVCPQDRHRSFIIIDGGNPEIRKPPFTLLGCLRGYSCLHRLGRLAAIGATKHGWEFFAAEGVGAASQEAGQALEGNLFAG